jgi:hypothetical protein
VAQPIFQRAAYSAIGAPGPAERVPTLFFSSARGIQGLRNSYQQLLTILMTMVGVVLMIACGNVSMLIAARVPIGLVLKTSSANTTADRGKTRAGQAIVAAQIALCLVLLVGAGLLVRTLQNLNRADLGLRASFRPDARPRSTRSSRSDTSEALAGIVHDYGS